MIEARERLGGEWGPLGAELTEIVSATSVSPDSVAAPGPCRVVNAERV